MDKEKQIDEMTAEFNAWCDGVSTDICATRECTRCCAEVLYDKGYRKASDVAREIFAEIERVLNLSKCYGDSGIYFEKDIETDIAELKKKYTEEGK